MDIPRQEKNKKTLSSGPSIIIRNTRMGRDSRWGMMKKESGGEGKEVDLTLE